MGAAENQIRKFMADGGLDHLEGSGKPLPERHVPPFVSRDEAVLNEIVDRLTHERDTLTHEDKAVYKKSALRSEINDRREHNEHPGRKI